MRLQGTLKAVATQVSYLLSPAMSYACSCLGMDGILIDMQMSKVHRDTYTAYGMHCI